MTEIMLGKLPELVVNSYFRRAASLWTMLRYEHRYPYVIGQLAPRSNKVFATCRCTTAPVRRAAAATR